MDGESNGTMLGPLREAFRVPEEIAYFNTASLSPQPKVVHQAGQAALDRRGRPWDITSADWFTEAERLRGLFGSLIGADAEGIALIPATSYGFAVIARNLPLTSGDRVLVLADEYPSGIYAWRAATRPVGAEIHTVRRPAEGGWTEAVLGALDERVRVVSVPNVHWTDGALVDLAAVSERCRAVGAKLVIDGSQSIGALPLDVSVIRPDFLVTVGYKWLLGPFGVAYLYVAEEYRDGEPIEQNWILRNNAEDFASLVDYRDEYQPGSRRFDVGARTKFELLPMALAAIQQVRDWRIPVIAASLGRLNGSLAARIGELGLATLPADRRGPHILGIQLTESMRSTILPALEATNCYAGVRGRSLRISPHLHTTPADVERLVAALTGIVTR